MIIKNRNDLIILIREVQRKAGLTDEKIAHYGELSKATVSQLLSGKSKDFTFQTLLKIAKALDSEVEISFRKKTVS